MVMCNMHVQQTAEGLGNNTRVSCVGLTPWSRRLPGVLPDGFVYLQV